MAARHQTSFLFDLDGTLVDSVYQHVLAWRDALDQEGIELSVWRIHRKIGMSGGLFTNMLLRETGLKIDPERVKRLRHIHGACPWCNHPLKPPSSKHTGSPAAPVASG